MAKTRFIQSSFTSGVLSSLLRGRTDLDQYYQGLETGKNFVIMPQGGAKRRPGTEFIQKALPVLTRNTTAATVVNGGTAGNINDDSDASVSTTTVSISTVDPYVVAKIDLGAATYIEVADVRGIFLTVDSTSSEFVVQYSSDDVTFTTAATVPLIGVTSQDFRLAVRTSARYWRLARIGATDLTTNKLTISDFSLRELSSTLSNVNLRDFSVDTDSHYLLSITDGNIRIFKSPSTHVADIKIEHTSAQIPDIRDTQSESVMLLFQKDQVPKRLINLGTDVDWSIDDIPFTNVPQYDFNDSSSPTPTSDVQVLTFTAFVAGDTFQIDIEGVLSKNVTYAGDTTADERTSTAENIRKNIQDMPVMGETGVSVARTGAGAFTVTTAGESAKAFELFSAFATSGTASKTVAVTHSTTGVARKEDVWSGGRGYPKTACFYEGRLVLGGTTQKPQSIFMSKSGSAFDFELGEGDDDDGIFTTISSRKLTDIVDVFPGRNLQVFTSGAEFAINITPVTPSTIAITPQTSHGSLNIEAQEIDGATIFADRNGKSIKEFVYSFNEDAYVAADSSVLSPELIKTPVDIAILGGTSSDDANWVFIVNTDGSATVLNTLRAQDINGFTEWTTSGSIKKVAVVDDELYMVNRRTVGGVTSCFIERWSFDHKADCSLIKTVAASVTGLDHLEGETVKVSADDTILADQAVSSGTITMATDELNYTNVEVGLLFTPSLKTMPINTNIGSGSNAMRLKRVVRMNVRVENTSGLYIDGTPVAVRNFDVAAASPLDSPPEQKTGIIDDVLGQIGWQRDDVPVLTLPDLTSCTILAIEYEVESS
jgi:hypothetical protein